MMIADATTRRLIGFEKSERLSTQIRAPRIPIIPKRAVPAPPSAPIGVAARTAPNLGESERRIAPMPATQYAAVE